MYLYMRQRISIACWLVKCHQQVSPMFALWLMLTYPIIDPSVYSGNSDNSGKLSSPVEAIVGNKGKAQTPIVLRGIIMANDFNSCYN